MTSVSIYQWLLFVAVVAATIFFSMWGEVRAKLRASLRREKELRDTLDRTRRERDLTLKKIRSAME
jgi:hypothetical protein